MTNRRMIITVLVVAAAAAAGRLLSRALPGPLRNALWLARGVASIGVHQRW